MKSFSGKVFVKTNRALIAPPKWLKKLMLDPINGYFFFIKRTSLECDAIFSKSGKMVAKT